jgi:hypothetical protein
VSIPKSKGKSFSVVVAISSAVISGEIDSFFYSSLSFYIVPLIVAVVNEINGCSKL